MHPSVAPLLSRLVVAAILRVPRGSSRLLSAAAGVLPGLQDYPVPLRFWPERLYHMDLRETQLHQILRHQCMPHQIGEDLVAKAVLRPGDVVYDVGANVGYTTLIYLSQVGPDGRVHAFEPVRRAHALIRRNLLPGDPVVLVPAAVGAKQGSVEFVEYGPLALSSVADFGAPEARDHQPVARYNVDCIRLDDYWKESGSRPAFIKIDVEGYEPAVLEGAKSLLREVQPFVQFEAFSEQGVREASAPLDEALPAGYRIRRIDYSGALVGLDDERATNNFIALPPWAEERLGNEAIPADREEKKPDD